MTRACSLCHRPCTHVQATFAGRSVSLLLEQKPSLTGTVVLDDQGHFAELCGEGIAALRREAGIGTFDQHGLLICSYYQLRRRAA